MVLEVKLSARFAYFLYRPYNLVLLTWHLLKSFIQQSFNLDRFNYNNSNSYWRTEIFLLASSSQVTDLRPNYAKPY